MGRRARGAPTLHSLAAFAWADIGATCRTLRLCAPGLDFGADFPEEENGTPFQRASQNFSGRLGSARLCRRLARLDPAGARLEPAELGWTRLDSLAFC